MTSSDMTELCKQCAEDAGIVFAKDDLASLTTKSQSKEGLYARALCEGCGFTIVNHKGECVSKNCTRHHGDY